MTKRQSVHEAVLAILNSERVGSQEALRERLAEQGHDVTQSTVSRTLKKLGAVRTYNDVEETSYYALPAVDELPQVSSSIMDLVVDLTHNEMVVVVNTKPGGASLIARHVDFNCQSVIGTVAGDDCFFAMPKSVKKMNETIEEIKKVLKIEG